MVEEVVIIVHWPTRKIGRNVKRLPFIFIYHFPFLLTQQHTLPYSYSYSCCFHFFSFLMALQSPSSSSSSFSYGFTYDVFISFRGTDTRYGFTGNLYRALCESGIRTFIDDIELQRGDEITPSLVKAIEESRIFIPVFSIDYASSSFCLDELVHIMECSKAKGRLVLPVFYGVDPSHVRYQTDSYGKAIAKREKRFQNKYTHLINILLVLFLLPFLLYGSAITLLLLLLPLFLLQNNNEDYTDNIERLQKWKMALKHAANLSGHHFNPRDKYEHEVVSKIVKEVSNKINRVPLRIADYPVGLESRVLQVNLCLHVGSDDVVRMVHCRMCTQLGKLVDKVFRIFPHIEEARPRSSSGIQSLCSLSGAIDKAKQLLQHCSESSKLYLAMTGESILSKCQQARKSFEKSLVQIQDMVPIMLAVEISRIIDDLMCVTFVLDSAEEEAGRVMRKLLQQGPSTLDEDSKENSDIKSFQFAAARLNITSATTIFMEKRSIKKLLKNVGPKEETKNVILKNLLYLLKKYGNSITGEHMEVYSHSDSLCIHHVKSDRHMNYDQYRTHASELNRHTPPEEYTCPISLRLMYDPVVIASGETYERMWIQKWFDEGNVVCPKTKKKLTHMALTPNVALKDLISKWCETSGVSLSVPDPSRQAEDIHLSKLHERQAEDIHLSKLHERQWDSQCQVIEDMKIDFKYNSAASSALTSVSKILDSGNKEYQQKAIRIICNLSSNAEICSYMLSLGIVPKLLPFIEDKALLRDCISILKNLCDTEDGRVSVTETEGCMSCVVEILGTGSDEEKELALAIVLSMCSQRLEYCHLVMEEGIIPYLVNISNMGNDSTKAYAFELLRQLKDVEYEGYFEPHLDSSRDSNDHFEEKKSSKKSTFFKKLFSKSSSVSTKNKR